MNSEKQLRPKSGNSYGSQPCFPLDRDWQARSAQQVTDPGTIISRPDYPTQDWLPAVVPGTTLGTLLANGVYEDPYFGTHNNDIPDISEQGVDFYTYWFRTSFQLPKFASGTRLWLDLRGINYTASLFLNGEPVDVGYLTPPTNTVTGQPLAENEIQGMFLRQAIEITDLVLAGGVNVLAVQVQPPNPPGVPGSRNGGDPSEPNIANNVTMRYSVGWDWVIPIRDRNTGIWDRIEICTTGPVRLRHPQMVTRVLDADGNLEEDATLNLSVEARNASNSTVRGILSYVIEETGDQESQVVELQAGETQTLTFPTLTLETPRLWWPRGYGSPELYSLSFSFAVEGSVSDLLQSRFGIREIRVTCVDVPESNAIPPKSRQFAVNGQPIFLRGTNWIGTDALLRQEYLSAQRYRDEVRQLADANLNLLRIWGGGIAERPEFYQACDELGMLVMQDFWISGEYNPSLFERQRTGQSYPEGYEELFLSSARDTIRMLRNHPSLCFWCGGNENEPPAAILDALESYITGQTISGPDCERSSRRAADSSEQALDPTRILVPKSTSIANDYLDNYDDGPYGIQDPVFFFTPDQLKSNPFNPELGSVGTPIAATLSSMMTAADAADFPAADGRVEPSCDINPTWCLHDYITYIDGNGQNLMEPYGYPTEVERFGFLAQVLNFEQYRALFEGYNTGMYSRYTGVMLWKGQNPWQGLRGSLYDWMLDTTGGLFGVRSACEPVHVQLNLDDETFLVVNTTATALLEASVTATVVDLRGEIFSRDQHTYSRVPEHSLSERVEIDIPSTVPQVYLLVLELTAADGSRWSRNLYWRSSERPPSFEDLNNLPAIVLDGSVDVTREGDSYRLAATVTNPSTAAVAFFVRLETRKARSMGDDARILPCTYSENYFTLMPGEQRFSTITCRVEAAGGEPPELWARAWNVAAQEVPPT